VDAVIQNDLAAMLTKGIGTDKNPEKALFWLNKAAEQKMQDLPALEVFPKS
jgi:TPR repeat protein